ncbi:MAG TPA: DUF3099 domain-containing protein [Mycobacteriales bacterium]|nr:DUF3099 domain-containing protein [Mycobacteriales bacterium]
MRHETDEPVLVTTAAQSPVEERNARERRYLITMGIRVIAFISAIFLSRWSWWLAAIAIALSLVLPWVAVVSANAPRRTRSQTRPSLYRGESRRELEGPSDTD